MKLKHTFEMMEIDEQQMAVPVGDGADAFHGILKLNKSAAAILELLREDTTEEEMVQKLMEDYDTSEEEIRTYVHDYVEELKAAGFICE